MIIKSKSTRFNFLKKILYIFNKFLLILGAISLLVFLFFVSYYLTSGMKERFAPLNLIYKVDQVIFNKYLGFSFFKIDDYLRYKIKRVKYLFFENNLENLFIKIDQENLYNLELQREEKKKNISNDSSRFSLGELVIDNKKIPIKLRVKGDRVLHWYNKNETSYKIDIRGIDRLWGMEEFSLQKPITRNYTYEYLFHKFLEFNDLISLNYFFVNLYINDNNQGIYAVEEGFSKELIERNKRRNGPIFGLEEKKGTLYPFIEYDLYSDDFWISNYPTLTTTAFSKLNILKSNDQENLNQIFDIKKWAKFFAIIDFTNTLHGAIPKSVKLFYNPVSEKFEPIGFDGHAESGDIKDFIILDFLDPYNKKCSYICKEREWFLRFLKNRNGKINNEFVDLYLYYLKLISSQEQLNQFKNKYLKKINFYNEQFYSDVSKIDKGYYKGIAPFEFNRNFLDERSSYIANRLSSIYELGDLKVSLNNKQISFDNLNKFFLKKINLKCDLGKISEMFVIKDQILDYDKNCKYYVGKKLLSLYKNIYINKTFLDPYKNIKDITEYDLKFENGVYYLESNLEIKDNIYLPKDKKLFISSGVNIKFINDSVFISEGSINFNGTNLNPIKIYSDTKVGSMIFYNNTYKLNNVLMDNLSFPKNKNSILYGGLNIIDSIVNIKNTEIKNSNSEDAINIINSKTNITDLKMNNIKADALDVDFGEINFTGIYCDEIQNDCLDVSGGLVDGTKLITTNVFDKGLSFGESSKGNLINSIFMNNKIAIAVKDGSKLSSSNINMDKNDIDIAIFKKKRAYENSEMSILNTKDKKNLKVFLGADNIFLADQTHEIIKLKNSEMNQLFY